MNRLHLVRSRPWLLALLVVGFVAGHLFLLHVLWRSSESQGCFSSSLLSIWVYQPDCFAPFAVSSGVDLEPETCDPLRPKANLTGTIP